MKYAAVALLAGLFSDLIMGRRGPQDIPASHPLFALTFTVYAAATALLTTIVEGWFAAVKATLVDGVVMIAFVWLVLWLRNFANRFLQTLTATAGAGALFTLAVIPPFVMVILLPDSPLKAPASLAVMAIYIWNVLALGNIFRHALSLIFPAGLLVAVAYVIISTVITGFLVPEVAL